MESINTELEIVNKKMFTSCDSSAIGRVATEFVCKSGKKLRSVLALLYFKALGCKITPEVLDVLIIGELIHNASLLHDDVLDEADFRRDEKTIAKKYSEKISILTGDYLLSVVVNKLLEIDNKEVFYMFNECVKSMTGAEAEQFFLRGNLPSQEQYISICRGKTAKLFSCILEVCAMLLAENSINARKFGEIFGICFQIKNDLNEESAMIDSQNKILTAKDVLGIEKTAILLDNYGKDMMELLETFPENVYKKNLKDLIEKYVR